MVFRRLEKIIEFCRFSTFSLGLLGNRRSERLRSAFNELILKISISAGNVKFFLEIIYVTFLYRCGSCSPLEGGLGVLGWSWCWVWSGQSTLVEPQDLSGAVRLLSHYVVLWSVG